MPYIPKKHEKYDLLPCCRRDGGEVFEYPASLIYKLEKLIGLELGIFPYNYDSYEEYYGMLDGLIEKYAADSSVADLLRFLKAKMQEMNCKEEWSVLKYIGPSGDSCLGLTQGRNYYWPAHRSNPTYGGVIDDEEFTAYLYPTAKELWEILEDPTGMAYNTIYNNGKGSLSVKDYDRIMAQLADTPENGEDTDSDFSQAK